MVYSPFGFGSDIAFAIVPVIVTVGFIVILGLIVVMAIKGARQWHRNNESPVLTVDATVVAKRTAVSHHHHGTHAGHNMHHSGSSTTYYATFEVASGDRIEFRVRDTEYGMLVERDAGSLTFQGTRYLGFARTR